MKKLTIEEQELLSFAELRVYKEKLSEYDWSQMSLQEKDNDTREWQMRFIPNRDGYDLCIENEIDIINGTNTDTEKIKEFLGTELYKRTLARHKVFEAGEKFHFFWQTQSPFSQWHKSSFLGSSLLLRVEEHKKKDLLNGYFPVEGQQYSSAEQFMMYHKAITFLDREIAKKIMQTDDVREIKNLGRQVKCFDEKVWEYYRSIIVYQGNKAKFTQNESLKQALFATQGTTLVEAAPNDAIWGIGLAEEDNRAQRRDTWLGKNLLGEILTQLRVDLMGTY